MGILFEFSDPKNHIKMYIFTCEHDYLSKLSNGENMKKVSPYMPPFWVLYGKKKCLPSYPSSTNILCTFYAWFRQRKPRYQVQNYDLQKKDLKKWPFFVNNFQNDV